MKNSIKNVSCKSIGGLLFFNSATKPRIITVQNWIAQDCPDNVFIYDELWILLANKIPIVDAHESRGFWIRLPHLAPRQPWSGTIRIPGQLKIKRSSKLELKSQLVLETMNPSNIGTREIVC